jgi:hypothetical protein
MYKFGAEFVVLGMRFYKFISDDEYKIFVLVKILNDNNAQFMDEETFEIVTIDNETLSHEYTLLTMNRRIFEFYINTTHDINPNNTTKVSIMSYLFLRKIVFEKTINNILELNFGYTPTDIDSYPISVFGDKVFIRNELDILWYEYYICHLFRTTSNNPLFYFDNQFFSKLDAENKRLSDDAIMEIEESLSTYILSYDIYEYDESVNLDNVNMKYFFIYCSEVDKYYIVLYLINTEKVSAKILEDMEENIDLIEFMDQ